jgi:large conductance mechanosensitive channel
MASHISGFLEFIRERGVAGLAIGFILGGAAQNLVKALMDDIINPLLGYMGGIRTMEDWAIGAFKVGNFFSVLLNFLILCLIVYIIFKMLKLERLDKPKDN